MDKILKEIIGGLFIDGAFSMALMPALIGKKDIERKSGLKLTNPFRRRGVDYRFRPQIDISSDNKSIEITIPDALIDSVAGGSLEPYYEEISEAFAKMVDSSILSEINDFSNSVGTCGADMTMENFLGALYTLESAEATSPYIAVLHPIQIHDLRVAIAASTTSMWSAPSAVGADLGAFASLHDVDIYKSVNCASVNQDMDRQGVMMPMGEFSGLSAGIKVTGDITYGRNCTIIGSVISIGVDFEAECTNTSASGGVAIITDHE